MSSYKNAFGNYLKSDDLAGKECAATIERCTFEDVKSDRGTEKRLVVRFMGKGKALILNRTNAEAIATITRTDDFERWNGTPVVLYPARTTFGAKSDVPCIRLRGTARPAAPPPEPTEFTSDDFARDDTAASW